MFQDSQKYASCSFNYNIYVVLIPALFFPNPLSLTYNFYDTLKNPRRVLGIILLLKRARFAVFTWFTPCYFPFNN